MQLHVLQIGDKQKAKLLGFDDATVLVSRVVRQAEQAPQCARRCVRGLLEPEFGSNLFGELNVALSHFNLGYRWWCFHVVSWC